MKIRLTLLLLVAAAPAVAWDNRGHRVTGELAYDRLVVSDPVAARAMVAIMARHPDRVRFDRALGGLAGPARDRRMAGLMARWPDDIRGTAWDRPDWHYALNVAHGWTWLRWYTAGKAERQWAANLTTARDTAARPADRAVALCWLLHIGGDMHQPLHRGHRLDADWPKTDRAGTIAWVRRAPGSPPMELHQLWDQAFDEGGDEDAAVDRLRAALSPVAAGLTPTGDFDRWIDESETLAREQAYAGPALRAAATPAAAPAMTPPYMAMLRRVSAMRLAQAGARMGEALRGLR